MRLTNISFSKEKNFSSNFIEIILFRGRDSWNVYKQGGKKRSKKGNRRRNKKGREERLIPNKNKN